MKNPPQVLLVISSLKSGSHLLGNVRSLGLGVLAVSDCRQAREALRTHPEVKVVVSDVTLSDGNWSGLLSHLVDQDMTASLVVRAPSADERLWSEALWRGVYDILVEPQESDEVRRVIEGALRAAHTSSRTAPPRAIVAASVRAG